MSSKNGSTPKSPKHTEDEIQALAELYAEEYARRFAGITRAGTYTKRKRIASEGARSQLVEVDYALKERANKIWKKPSDPDASVHRLAQVCVNKIGKFHQSRTRVKIQPRLIDPATLPRKDNNMSSNGYKPKDAPALAKLYLAEYINAYEQTDSSKSPNTRRGQASKIARQSCPPIVDHALRERGALSHQKPSTYYTDPLVKAVADACNTTMLEYWSKQPGPKRGTQDAGQIRVISPKSAFALWFEERDELIWERDWAEFITLITHEVFKAASWEGAVKYNRFDDGLVIEQVPGGYRCTARPQPEPEPEPEPEPAAATISPDDWKAFQEFMAFREFQKKQAEK